jgi:thiol-disulfide isomerase/thioredoxin
LALAIGLALTPLRGWAQSDVAAKLVFLEAARALPEIRFLGQQEQHRRLSEFQGKVLLLNVWATWCVPCREEMPALDRLQAELGGGEFAVVPLSVDRAGVEAVRDFYSEIGIEHLPIYVMDDFSTARVLRVQGLPTTLLIDREGLEVARLIGPADWAAPEALSFLQDYLQKQ